MDWLAENWGTIVVSLVLIAMVVALVRVLIKDRKKPGCGGNCASCGSCHSCPSSRKDSDGADS